MHPVDSAPLRVLLVDDSVVVRDRLRSLIEEAGPVELVGETGASAEALQCFYAKHPDAVIVDVELADCGASGIVMEVKRLRPECVVIVLSAVGIPEFRDLAMRMGADFYFDKSREFERVPEVLQGMRREGRTKAEAVARRTL